MPLFSLEGNLQRQLDLARGGHGAADATDATPNGSTAGEDIGRWMSEVGMVDDVEELGPELHSDLFAQIKPFGDTEIQLDDSITTYGRAAQITIGSPQRQLKDTRIKPTIWRA